MSAAAPSNIGSGWFGGILLPPESIGVSLPMCGSGEPIVNIAPLVSRRGVDPLLLPQRRGSDAPVYPLGPRYLDWRTHRQTHDSLTAHMIRTEKKEQGLSSRCGFWKTRAREAEGRQSHMGSLARTSSRREKKSSRAEQLSRSYLQPSTVPSKYSAADKRAKLLGRHRMRKT